MHFYQIVWRAGPTSPTLATATSLSQGRRRGRRPGSTARTSARRMGATGSSPRCMMVPPVTFWSGWRSEAILLLMLSRKFWDFFRPLYLDSLILLQSITKWWGVYLGLYNTGKEGGWAWSDGSPVCYTNWNKNEPNGCVGSVRRTGLWGCKLGGIFLAVSDESGQA